MGQKIHPLIFRSLFYKNYLNNFYINWNFIYKNNNFKYILLIIYFLNFMFNNIINNNDYYFNIFQFYIYFFINKFCIILIIWKYKFIKNLKYIFILINYLNYYYYLQYSYICILKVKIKCNININLILIYIKLYYLKYKSFKLFLLYLYNNLLKKNFLNIKGLKIKISGRFKASLKSKIQVYTYGMISLHTLNNNIKYINDVIYTKYGKVGIKIWLCN